MSPWMIPIAVPAGILLFVVNGAKAAGFDEFCRLIARRDGRLDEWLAGTRDDVDCDFESEQRRQLRSREYRMLGDEKITALGDRIIRRERQLLVLNVATVIALIYLVA